MARFFSRNRSILKYLSKLNRQKSFTDRLTTSTTLQQTSSREEYEADKEYNLLTKDDDQKAISDSATVRAIAATLTGSGVSSKDAIINLASSGLTAGDASIVFIDSNNAKYYISNGSGWYNVALVNADPQWDSAPNSSYTLDSTNPLTIEPIAIDSGGKIFSYTATLDNDASQFLTITKDSDNGRIFTLVGESAGAAPGSNSGIVTFRASDGRSFVTQNSTINLIYQSTGTLTSSVSSVNEGSSVTFTLPTTGYSDGTTFAYTITGIQAGDISQGLTGNMTVASNNATVTINIVADVTTEGAQTMTFSADDQSVNVTINDTSTGPQAKATGGTITFDGNDVIHTFTYAGVGSGTSYTFAPSESLVCDWICVGGGAPGGGYRGGSYALGSGGGGAGGYEAGTGTTISSSISIYVGKGGVYSNGATTPAGGIGSTIGGGIAATNGGGAGGSITIWNGTDGGYNGGSGGGGAGSYSYNGGGGNGTPGEGNNGGAATKFSNSTYGGAGGGGASSAGGGRNGAQGGTGGNGTSNSISGTAVIYAAGGGGGSFVETTSLTGANASANAGYAGPGGSSGAGGDGGVSAYNSGNVIWTQHGTDGSTPGSGGGGAGRATATELQALPGNGAHGIVIIRYSGM